MILKGITLNKPKQRKGYSAGRDSFYHSPTWRKFRKSYLIMNPLCVICDNQGKVTEATVLDHKRRIKDGGHHWDESNLQGLCKRCNAIKTALDNPNNQF